MFLRSSSSFHIPLAGLMAGAAALASVGLMSSAVKADTVILYSTQGDFTSGSGSTGFTGNNGGTAGPVVSTVGTVSSPTEGGTVNGIVSATPGGAGTAGALAITLPNGITPAANYQLVATSANQNFGTVTGAATAGATVTPSALDNALNSGGTLTLQYTVPTGTTYLNPPTFLINYPKSYDQLSGTASATKDANGFYTETISLAGIANIAQSEQTYLQTTQYGYLNFGIILNGVVPAGSVVNIANIEVQTPVPEPTTIGVLALGGLGLLLVGRRRKSA